MSWTILAVIVLTLALSWAFFTAQRLNRLHIRVDAALSSLQSALDRRAAVVAALEPSASELAQHAESIRLTPALFDDRAAAERKLMESVTSEHPLIVDASARVQLAHRFYNDAVSDTRAVRTRPLVRALRLGGTARLPVYFELRS
ncbi:hypothetical protein J5O04_07490 [Corynebacterium hindlerae]|uniref:hypothetical protein n=1 Tax=Corynebacterium hindlerae TaxID=699041 RepID=UPI001AD6745B|nr:hypothetical protein [Corynebacterium hindlerae]QTH58689.1 hypothetical protein J5O04_07490 [Corynebacterium hindlerae]